MASRRRSVSEQEAEEFRRAIGAVRPLADDRVHPAPSRPPPRLRRQALPQAVDEALMPDGLADSAPAPGERQHFARPGVQQRLLRRLARGQLAPQDELDLHGMRVEEARRALAAFLAECRARSLRCVRVIPGKGFGSRAAAPVLKGHVDRWLRLRPEVLAFCSALPRDGGTGALYVLLAREPG